ncbi:MAG: cytochrome ubiquinol oxidase subunit I, partial [Pseudomonadota bacterium]|nr:cytochrome ubiquinol oxidase subunit I [Pseudomonadota bacterium]
LYDSRWFLRVCRMFAPIGFIAMIMGWVTTEVGRQPWVVYGMLRTADAVSHVPMRNVIISLVLIVIVYGIIFGIFYFLYLFKTIHAGPDQKTLETQPFGYMEPQTQEKK